MKKSNANPLHRRSGDVRSIKSKIVMIASFLLLFSFLFSLFSSPVFAQACNPQEELCHPFAGRPVVVIVGGILQKIVGMLGVIAFAVIVVAAVRWMTAAGNQENVQKARDSIIWASLGLVVAGSAYAILEFVFNVLRGSLYG